MVHDSALPINFPSTGKTHRYPSWWEEWAIPQPWPDDNMLALTAHDYSKNRKKDNEGGAVCVHAPSDYCKVLRLMSRNWALC